MDNKIGICEWSLPIDGPYACRLAAELGLQGIQLDVGPYERGFSKSRGLVQEAYLEMGAAHGIAFPSMAARVTDYFSMFPSRSRQESAIAREGIWGAIQSCAVMGISLLLLPNFERSAIATATEFAEAVEVFKWACDEAGSRGITVAAENALSTEETLRFLGQIDRANLGLYFDTQNYHFCKGYDTARMLDELMPHILEIHVKDGTRTDLSGALLGQGDSGFHRSVEVIKRTSYGGWIILENYYDRPPLSRLSNDPTALISDDLSTLRAALR